MTAQNEVTEAEAEQILREAEAAFMARDVARILRGFTPDVVVRYADFPEMVGLAALEAWLSARFRRQLDYRLQKTLRAVSRDTIAGWFEGRWEDAVTGKTMHNRGCEILTMRDGKIARWDCTTNAWESGSGPTTPLV